MAEPARECDCGACVGACMETPGRLAPSDLGPMATLLGLEVDDLILDRLEQVPGETALRPKRQLGEGPCIFLTGDCRCEVHKAKPQECAEMDCEAEDPNGATDYGALVQAWREHWRARMAQH